MTPLSAPRRSRVCAQSSSDISRKNNPVRRCCSSAPGIRRKLRAQCLSTPDTTTVRNVAIFRGRTKVDAQWKPYRLVHNIEKLASAGYAA